jgi:hypothetical protein
MYDEIAGMQYYSIIEEPRYIDSLVPVDTATLPEWLSTESMTVTYWIRMENMGRVFKWYRDLVQPVVHLWSDVAWTNIRYTRGEGVTSGEVGSWIDDDYRVRPDAWRLHTHVFDSSTKSVRMYLMEGCCMTPLIVTGAWMRGFRA